MASKTDDAKGMHFLVKRDDLRRCRFVPAEAPDQVELADGQALLRVDRFGFTANNVTYAVVGEMMSYWNFFPAEPGWGRVPVWGFAEVARSRVEGLPEGERVFGYLPISTHLLVQAEHVTPGGFVDASSHRSALPAVYNQYVRVANDPAYDARHEDAQMLLWPLFATSFLLDDFLAENGFFGAKTLVIASASSKTAIALAFLLAQRRGEGREIVGLTSPGNAAFVEGLGFYDRVLTYDAIASLPRDGDAVFVDMAGDVAVSRAVHSHFGERLKHSSRVGLTHWERGGAEVDLPGPPPSFFFAPTQAEKRSRDWGPAGVRERMGSAWKRFVETSGDWLRVVHGQGPKDVERVYQRVLEGHARPEEGHVLSLCES